MEKQDILSPSIKRDTARSNRVVLEKTFKYIMSGTRGLKFYTVFSFFFFLRTFCFFTKVCLTELRVLYGEERRVVSLQNKRPFPSTSDRGI